MMPLRTRQLHHHRTPTVALLAVGDAAPAVAAAARPGAEQQAPRAGGAPRAAAARAAARGGAQGWGGADGAVAGGAVGCHGVFLGFFSGGGVRWVDGWVDGFLVLLRGGVETV